MVNLKEGSKRYKALLDEALDLHIRKNQGYSASNPDAFSNFRLAEGMGLTAVQGVMVRLSDKYARAASLISNPDNDKVGESLRDTLMDLSAYALIAICLMEEEALKHTPPLDPNDPLCCELTCIECEGSCTDCKPGCVGHQKYNPPIVERKPEITVNCCVVDGDCGEGCLLCLPGCKCRPLDPEDLMC